MPVVSLFKLRQLDGFLNKRLGELQDSRVSRQLLKRSPDLCTFTSRYKNWNIGSGITIFVNGAALLSEDVKYSFTAAAESFSVFDASGNPVNKVFAVNRNGSIKFDNSLKTDDSVEAEFSFRMVSQEDIHGLLYAGLMDVQRRMYSDFDPDAVPSAITDLVIEAATMKFFEAQDSETSLLYDYKVQDQLHNKSQVAENIRASINRCEKNLEKGTKAALWRIGNGRARGVISVKGRYETSAGLRGYNGSHEDGV